MATKYTSNLRLRIEDSLSAASIYNLHRLDELGATFVVDSTDDLVISSREGIVFQPSADGSAITQGTIVFASAAAPASQVDIWTDGLYVNGELMPAASDIATISGGELEPDLGLPASNGQVLKSDTDGLRYWATLTGLVASQNVAVDWAPVEGNSFTYTHGYGTSDIEVQIYDIAAGAYIAPDSVTFPDNNNVTLNVINAPTTTWKVFVREVLTV